MQSGDLDRGRAREVFDDILTNDRTAAESMNALGIEKVDASEIEDLCRELLAANPKVVADLQAGNLKAVGALIGQAKKKNPNADPGRVRELCLRLASEF